MFFIVQIHFFQIFLSIYLYLKIWKIFLFQKKETAVFPPSDSLWTLLGLCASLISELPQSSGLYSKQSPVKPKCFLVAASSSSLSSCNVFCLLHCVQWGLRQSVLGQQTAHGCTGWECDSLWQMVVALSPGRDRFEHSFSKIKHTSWW